MEDVREMSDGRLPSPDDIVKSLRVCFLSDDCDADKNCPRCFYKQYRFNHGLDCMDMMILDAANIIEQKCCGESGSGYNAGWQAGYDAGYLAADSYIQNEGEGI